MFFFRKNYMFDTKKNQTFLALKTFEKNSNYYTKLQYHYVEHLNF